MCIPHIVYYILGAYFVPNSILLPLYYSDPLEGVFCLFLIKDRFGPRIWVMLNL